MHTGRTLKAMRQGGRKLLLLYHKANASDEVTYASFTIADIKPGEVANASDLKLDDIDPDTLETSGGYDGGGESPPGQ